MPQTTDENERGGDKRKSGWGAFSAMTIKLTAPWSRKTYRVTTRRKFLVNCRTISGSPRNICKAENRLPAGARPYHLESRVASTLHDAAAVSVLTATNNLICVHQAHVLLPRFRQDRTIGVARQAQWRTILWANIFGPHPVLLIAGAR